MQPGQSVILQTITNNTLKKHKRTKKITPAHCKYYCTNKYQITFFFLIFIFLFFIFYFKYTNCNCRVCLHGYFIR